MAYEYDVRQNYTEWKAKQTKAAETSQERAFNGKIFTRMGKVISEIIRFAGEFDEKLVDAETITGETAVEMRALIQDDLLPQVMKFKDIIKPNDWKEQKFNWDAESTKFFGSLMYLFDHADDFYQFCDLAITALKKALESTEKQETIPKIAENNLIELLINIFNDIKSYFVEIEKIEARDEDLFDFEDCSSTGSGKEASAAMEFLFPSISQEGMKGVAKAKTEKTDPRFQKHKISPVPEDVKMFPKGWPQAYEVKQAEIPDCYLMAALISLAKNNPEAIAECFPQGIENLDKKEEIIVRFYGYNKSGRWGPIDIKVNKRKVVAPEKIAYGALWPKIIEKAYVAYESRDYLPADKKRLNISLGLPEWIFSMITGNEPEIITRDKLDQITDETVDEKLEKKVISDITSALKDKVELTCKFKHFKTKDAETRKIVEIDAWGSYKITEIRKKRIKRRSNYYVTNYYVTIKEKPPSYMEEDPPEDQPDIVISIKDFCNYYKSINFDVVDDSTRKDEQKTIRYIKSNLKELECEFAERFEIKDVKTEKNVTIRGYTTYYIKDCVEAEPTSYVVVALPFGPEIAMSIGEFCKNNRYMKHMKTHSDDEKEIEPKIITKIKYELNKGHSPVVTFTKKFTMEDVKSKDIITISDEHAYAIAGVRDADDPKNKTGIGYVRLDEPLRSDDKIVTQYNIDIRMARPSEHNLKSNVPGKIAMAYETFDENYRDVTYTTNKKHRDDWIQKKDSLDYY